jgi:hypothetical protein
LKEVAMSNIDTARTMKDNGAITTEEFVNWCNYEELWTKPTEGQVFNDHEKVGKLITEYNGGTAPTYTLPAMNAEHPNTKPKAPVTDGMPPPVRSTSEKNDVVVSIEALKQFDKNVASLSTFVDSTYKSLALVNVKPGTFGAGAKIYNDVQLTLLPSSLDFLKKVSETFLHLRTDIGELVLEYETAEEWNKLTTQSLNEVFKETFDDIGNYQKVDPGTSAGPTPSPSPAA